MVILFASVLVWSVGASILLVPFVYLELPTREWYKRDTCSYKLILFRFKYESSILNLIPSGTLYIL